MGKFVLKPVTASGLASFVVMEYAIKPNGAIMIQTALRLMVNSINAVLMYGNPLIFLVQPTNAICQMIQNKTTILTGTTFQLGYSVDLGDLGRMLCPRKVSRKRLS